MPTPASQQEELDSQPAARQPANDPPSSPTARHDAGSSPGSSAAADPFVADPGRFDVDAEDNQEPPPPPEDAEPVLWTDTRVRRILALQGTLTHTLVGVAETDWVWSDAELDLVCGPLSDYANRVPALQAMAHLSDDAAIAAGFMSYLLRSWRERVAALRAADAEPTGPLTGRAPDPTEINVEEASWTIP